MQLNYTLNEQQQSAFDGINNWILRGTESFYVLRGFAGTGKTFLLKAILDKWPTNNFVFTAPTNKATKVLKKTLQLGDVQCKTIYSLLGIKMVSNEDRLVLEFPRIPVSLGSYSIVYVDEASMVNKELLAYIRKIEAEGGPRFIFIGDPAQLPPVGEENSGVWSLNGPMSELDIVMRFDNELLKFATHVRRQIQNYPNVNLKIRSNHSAIEGVWKYKKGLFLRNVKRAATIGMFTEIDNTKLIAWRNRTVNTYNAHIRAEIFKAFAPLPEWLEGDRLIISEPIQESGRIIAHVDDEGTVTRCGSGYHTIYKDLKTWVLSVRQDEGRPITLNVIHRDSEEELMLKLNDLALEARSNKSRWKAFWALRNSFHRVRYAYALTAHRAQGSTYRNSFVDSEDILTNSNSFESLRCLYVASSRSTDKLIMC